MKTKYATKESQVKAWINQGALGVWVLLDDMRWVKASKALAATLKSRKG